MAFTTRGRRDLSKVKTTTEESVGPGTYQQFSSFKSHSAKYSAAPFNSTTNRYAYQGKEPTLENPGPGTYSPPSYKEKYRSKGSVFRSGTERFREKESYTPGPGNYETHKTEWLRNKPRKKGGLENREKAKKEGIVWLKVNTVPSIPTGSNYGYEETETGKLVRQKGDDSRLLGTEHSSVGPGEYEIAVSDFKNDRREVGLSSFRSGTKRGGALLSRVKDLAPGPGSYSTVKPMGVQQSLFNSSSSFASGAKRIGWIGAKEKRPGPGAYVSHDTRSSFKRQKKPDRFQNFGSSSIRTVGIGGHNQSSPGPGSFIKNTSTLKLGGRSHGPFQSTSKRFHRLKKGKNPGPGAYKLRNSFSDYLSKRGKIGTYGVFGSTSRRFRKKEDQEKNPTPSVGDYNPKHTSEMEVIKKRNRNSCVFASSTRRTVGGVTKAAGKKKKKKLPGPGHYNIPSDFDRMRKRSRKRHTFNTTSKRFASSAGTGKAIAPGPGFYDIDRSYNAVSKKRDFSMLAHSAKNRRKKRRGPFVTAPQKKVIKWYDSMPSPGPGSYNMNEDWDKRSFNVTVM